MSYLYNEYLDDHIRSVQKSYEWLVEHKIIPADVNVITDHHDDSKYREDEYDAYDRYFYGNKSNKTVEDFNYAWLRHIHRNPHHWQYWVLINDDESMIALEMPEKYVYEMICDWWSFSWKSKNLYEIFDWYDEHKRIKLHPRTKKLVKDILGKIKDELDKENGANEESAIQGSE